jgi:hypothetical protein
VSSIGKWKKDQAVFWISLSESGSSIGDDSLSPLGWLDCNRNALISCCQGQTFNIPVRTGQHPSDAVEFRASLASQEVVTPSENGV